jgi:hypothetical protein
MQAYFGWDSSKWPAPNSPVAAGGPTLIQVFLTGANPMDPGTWLRTKLIGSPQGFFLNWNPRPGFTYQVQTSTALGGGWTNVGSPRFAAGNVDSLFVGLSNTAYYRVLLLR